MTTAAEALARARGWSAEAQRRTGPARDHALRAAAYWQDTHRRLAAGAPVAPPAGPVPPGGFSGGWAPAGAGMAGPASAPPRPGAGPPRPSPPPYAAAPLRSAPNPNPAAPPGPAALGRLDPPPGPRPTGYGPPYLGPRPVGPMAAAPRRGGSAGLVATLVVVGLFLVVGLAAGASAVVRGALATTPPVAGPQVAQPSPWTVPSPPPDPTPAPDPVPTPPPTPTPTVPPEPPRNAESVWKAGTYAGTLPDPVPTSASATAFLPKYPTAEEWLVAINPANEGIRVVFTDDPAYNCGLETVAGRNGPVAAGCYDPLYPRVLFMYWTPNATASLKEFILAHELSHLMQWWHHYDVVQSVVDSGLGRDAGWRASVESDATCRVLSWGGYDAAVAANSSSPCTADSWSEDWLGQQAAALGVTVTDH